MKSKYNELFKALITAYNNNNFESTVENILADEGINKEEFSSVISTLCGVEVSYSENYSQDLKYAISNYEANDKIVKRVHACSMNCIDENGKTACQKACPFNAIIVDKERQTTSIDDEICADCGFCIESCPSGGILDNVQFLPLLDLLKDNKPVIAAVAPAIVGQFGDDVSINKLRAAFKKVGFIDMVEVAFFADMLTLKEAVEFDHLIHDKDDFMITSCCCPMWVAMVKKVYSDLVKHVSPSVSPMIAAGRVIKELNQNFKVVFIGPCVAKKAEAKDKDLAGAIDFVLTFVELKEIFEAFGVDPALQEEDESSEYASRGGRLYARTGGVSIAVGEAIERLFPEKFKLLRSIQANGVKECKEILAKAQAGQIEADFIEGMGCVGGCVGGPKAILSKDEGTIKVNNFAMNSEIKVSTESNCMNRILRKIGIESIEDFKDPKKVEIFEREF